MGQDDLLWTGVGEATAVLDPDGVVVAVSPSYSRLFETCGGGAIGERAARLFGTDDGDGLLTQLRQAASSTPGTPLRLSVVSGEETFPVDVQALAPPQSSGHDGLLLVLRPVDDDSSVVAERMSRSLQQLRAVDEIKHRLLESVSHELRTPLTVISGFAQTLQRDGLSLSEAERERVVSAVQRQTERLQRLISDLIDLDRLSRGSLLTDPHRVELSEVVRDVLDGLDLGPHHHLTTELQVATATVDRPRFERIIEDLLINVVRHTPPGTAVTIRLTPIASGALLEVIDDGPGIPDELGDEAFLPFVQGRTAAPASPGLGLGLARVRRFSELHGGRAWLSAPDGGGTAVHVVLPSEAPAGLYTADLSRTLRSAIDTVEDTQHHPAMRPGAMETVAPLLRSVRRELGMEVAYIGMFTPTEQVILAVDGDGGALGIEAGTAVDLEETYCSRMVAGTIDTIIPDTRDETAVAGLPVTAAGLRAYAAVPLRLPDGYIVGTLCCADRRPRPALTHDSIGMLRAIARVVGDQLEGPVLVTNDLPDITQRVDELLERPDSVRTVYQPIIDLSTGDTSGFEALTRFPDSELRPPDAWFADATRVGRGDDLDQLALARALTGLRQLPAGCYLSVNLTPSTALTGALAPLLERVPLDRVVLEITEHAAVADYDELTAALQPYRDAGVRLAIDDVGSGFASLRHILRLSPDVLKIDRSLVANVATEPVQRAVATALTAVAAQLEASVVAEGIEDAETLDVLRDCGVTHGQGWLFARAGPLPLHAQRYNW